MSINDKVTTNRAFIKKVQHFIKHYPLYTKNPGVMIQMSLEKLVSEVESAQDITALETLSSIAVEMEGYESPDQLCQFPVEGDYKRFIIYKPCKFVSPDCTHLVDIFDLVFIPD